MGRAHRTTSASIAAEIDRLADDTAEPIAGRFFHHRIDRVQRTAVLRNVFLDSDPGWWRAFIVMMVLSSIVSTFGLSQNSAATVIGAMIIAPLAAPIVGLGGALAAGWPHQGFRMLGVVLAAATGSIAIAFALGFALPNLTPDAQILAQTQVYRQVGATIGPNTATEVLRVVVNGNHVVIDVTNPDAAPSAEQFEIDLRDEIGPDVSVTVK